MASNTYVALATAAGTGSSGTITFNSIPSTYTDLRIVLTGTETNATLYEFDMRYNNDTGNNYSLTYLQGNGSSASSGRYSSTNKIRLGEAGTDTTLPTLITIDVMNYANTTTYKSCLIRYNEFQSGAGDTGAKVALWRGATGSSTEAITRIDLLNLGGNFTTSTTATIYGIAAASVGAKATGGTIYQDASYFYHVFSGNGTFTPSQSISADVLVVAGGGGAGGNAGGGGGAGGLAYYSAQSLTATNYTCTVGSGGTKGTTNTIQATQGGNSTFGALTSAVGGGYGSYNGGGGSGGSGGGARGGAGTLYSGGTATSGQGNSGGGNDITAPNYGGGGGGGAGAAGAAGTNSYGGNGGVGLTTYSSWGLATGFGQNVSGTVYFAGGGGGGIYDVGTYGTGGYGGGGNAGTSNVQNAVDGTANTGGGGGGASGTGPTTNGGAGGSGVIIVRYAK